ncbi:MAG: hypothetical protein GXP27_16415, partial [Planctomycetes bacterium]|nr:hypothetical protein [Planctomycetota bacterium]
LQHDAQHTAKSAEPIPPLKQTLEEAANSMNKAAAWLRSRQAGPETQRLQAQILQRLKAALEQGQQALKAAARDAAQQAGQPRPSQPNRKVSPSPEQRQPDQVPKHDVEAGTGAGRAPVKPRPGGPGQGSVFAQRQFLMEHVWGHLPPAVRESLFNAYSEKSLPQYRELIEQYYRSLAEPQTSGP